MSVDIDVTYVVPKGLLQEVFMGANQFTTNSLTGHDVPAVCGVYLLTDTITGKTYIGSSKNVRFRAIQHFCNMKGRADCPPYLQFSATYTEHGSSAFLIEVLEICAEPALYERETHWISKLCPTENTQHSPLKEIAYSEKERALRSERAKKLWATSTYRERAVAARRGNTFAKGYKCTPEQTENRKRAARISNMKRNYGAVWKEEYARRYPEHMGDLDA